MPYTKKEMVLSAALDEVVQEAGLMALKPKQCEAIERIVSKNHTSRELQRAHCGQWSLASLRSGS